MKRIDDEKIRFYLKNQSLIEEWAEIARMVPAEVDRFMRSCSPRVEDLAAEVGATFWSRLEGGWPKLFLVRPGWTFQEVPAVAIGLQWRSGVVGFTSAERPVVGVWVDQDRPNGAALSSKIKAAFRHAQLLASPWQSSTWWPAWRYETAPGSYWDDLQPFSDQLVVAVHATWDTHSRIVDSTLAALG